MNPQGSKHRCFDPPQRRFELQQTSDLASGIWTAVTSPVDLVNGNNQVTITPLTGTKFYRLFLP
jgi:hypothetical protein